MFNVSLMWKMLKRLSLSSLSDCSIVSDPDPHNIAALFGYIFILYGSGLKSEYGTGCSPIPNFPWRNIHLLNRLKSGGLEEKSTLVWCQKEEIERYTGIFQLSNALFSSIFRKLLGNLTSFTVIFKEPGSGSVFRLWTRLLNTEPERIRNPTVLRIIVDIFQQCCGSALRSFGSWRNILLTRTIFSISISVHSGSKFDPDPAKKNGTGRIRNTKMYKMV